MARYVCIDLRLFNDDRIRQLSPLQPSAQALFLFLICNHRNSGIPGLYSAGRLALAEELGWEAEDFDRCFAELTEARMVMADWRHRVIWIPKCLKYNTPNASSIVIHWGKVADELCDCEIVRQGIQGLYECCQLKDETYQRAFKKAFPRFNATATRSGTPTASPTDTKTATNDEIANPSPVPPSLSPPAHIHIQAQIQTHTQIENKGEVPAILTTEDIAADLANEFHFRIPGMKKPLVTDLAEHFHSKLLFLKAHNRDETEQIRNWIIDPLRDKGKTDTIGKMYLFWQDCGIDPNPKEKSYEPRKRDYAPGGGRLDSNIEAPDR